MRVHITLYSRVSDEPALSRWVHVRTLGGARVDACNLAAEHIDTTPHGCQLTHYQISRRSPISGLMVAVEDGALHNGPNANMGAYPDKVAH